mmetsp:Transcript_136271/g.250773  ORF Transcript_136271/g.250773 Transcript_136271/m.250773 type:complete len:81 (-) Transcript_136271:21-263(-)
MILRTGSSVLETPVLQVPGPQAADLDEEVPVAEPAAARAAARRMRRRVLEVSSVAWGEFWAQPLLLTVRGRQRLPATGTG